MVFSSLLFIFIFLPIAIALFYLGNFSSRGNKTILYVLLTFLSLLFYFWGSGKMLLLLVTSIGMNWCIGNQFANMRSTGNKRLLLAIGIIINLSALFYFKYCRFFLDTLGFFAGAELVPDLHPYLPVGISFYTFMSISYLIDVYRSPFQKATLLEFGTYLSLFPHLVAGTNRAL